MPNYLVNIKEKQKFIRQLTFQQLNDEIYNFMYKKTILEHSRSNLSLHLLIYFLVLRDSNWNSLAYWIFEKYLDKVNSLNKKFEWKKWNLDAWEYSELKEKEWLTEIFKYDIFFYLIRIFSEIEKLFIEYDDFFNKNEYLKKEIELINLKFWKKVNQIFYEFYGYKIDDVREDDLGNIHDLSKSIYHPIKMRMSKRIDLTLSYRTDIKNITSKSPIDITFIQYIDPKIIFDVWDRFSLTNYIVNLWLIVTTNPLISTTIWWVLAQIAYKKIEADKLDRRKKVDSEKYKKLESEIEKLKRDFELFKEVFLLSAPIEKNIKNAELNLVNKIIALENRVLDLEKDEKKNKDEIWELKNEIKKLKNINVSTTIYNIQWNVWQLQNNTNDSNQDFSN